MNTMLRLMNRSVRNQGGPGAQDNTLGLMHLKKLYAELCYTAQPLSQKEQEDKLYMMLPLFCKVFENSPAAEMIDKFGDVQQFANHVARLFVTEVRRRASNISTEAASSVIAQYLEIKSSEDDGNGWVLLSSLNLLAVGGPTIVNTMTIASLPSTLVKCIYLFFDLTEVLKGKAKDEEGSEWTPYKRRELLQKTVIQPDETFGHLSEVGHLLEVGQRDVLDIATANAQKKRALLSEIDTPLSKGYLPDSFPCRTGFSRLCLFPLLKNSGLKLRHLFQDIESCYLIHKLLVRLCNLPSPAEELAKRDDLTLLFSAITSWCPPHNIPWRKGAAEILTTISRHGLTQEVVQYIHNKGCLALCVDNMQKVQDLTPLEIVEMCFTVFCFLKDSSDKSHILLDEFRTCQGYIFLADFVLRLESMKDKESIDSLRNLVLLISSLTMCGYQELRPNSIVYEAPFQVPGFKIPTPSGNGNSVRNLQAFQVLQTVFLKATTEHLCCTVLEIITSIYNSDNVNYFILEPQHTLSQFIDRMTNKTPEIQDKVLDLLEFVVFNLNFVPCKELISMSLLIKAGSSADCTICVVRCLLRILQHCPIYKNVFREVGLLEVMVTCLHRYAAALKDNQPNNNQDSQIGTVEEISIPEKDQTLAFLVMEALALLLDDNIENSAIFRECGGARCVHNLVPYIQCRQQALAVVQQLVLTGKEGEDDMGTLLGLMQSAPMSEMKLKTDLLQSMLNVLQESHKSRTIFRKVCGFLYIISVLIAMEGCLEDPPKEPWNTIPREHVFGMLHVMFQILAAGMRQEPANTKFFVSEIRYESLTNTLRTLGCFNQCMELKPHCYNTAELTTPTNTMPFHGLFDILGDPAEVPQCLHSACLILRCMYDLAVDAYSSNFPPMPVNSTASSHHLHDTFTPMPAAFTLPPPTPPPSPVRPSQSTSALSQEGGASSPVLFPPAVRAHSLPFAVGISFPPAPIHPTIVHPASVLALLDLMPSVTCCMSKKHEVALQMHIVEVIQELVKSERNQQVMCENSFPQRLLQLCSVALSDEAHPLHIHVQHMLERLASQLLDPKDLRDFLRLGNPLNCLPLDDDFATSAAGTPMDISSSATSAALPILSPCEPLNATLSIPEPPMSRCLCNVCTIRGNTVPLTRVKCLVSMTTPRDVRLSTSSVTPSFIEFDMSAEGYGCLYLPSIAPQTTPSQAVVTVGMATGSDATIISGIGTGERPFPPQAGISYAVWFCVDRFGVADHDIHSVRLLTIARNVVGTENHWVCLRISICGQDRTLMINTAEEALSKCSLDSAYTNDSSLVRVRCPDLAQEGQWHHLAVVFNKAVVKHTTLSLFVDGINVHSQKMPFIQANPGGGAASPSNITSVYSYIGTPPVQHFPSRLLWRLGPAHLFEDVLSNASVWVMYQLGPTYVGSFQAPKQDECNPVRVDLSALQIPEDRIVFGIHAHALSVLTVAKIRKAFNKVDSKAVAKQLGVSAHDNVTPVRILTNSASHLSGAGRSFAAVLIGNLGVRTFCPKPVASTLEHIGGSAPLLGLIAMATDVEGLYAAVKALVCVVKNNGPAMAEMELTRGYQILAFLLKKKKHLLNSHILHLTFSLVGTVDSGRETTIIPHRTAFEDLLCDLEVWHNAPYDLQRSLYEHFYELVMDSSEAEKNRRLMRQLRMVNRLLYMLHDSNLAHSSILAISNVLGVLLQGGGSANADLLAFGQFLASTLPTISADERTITDEEIETAVGMGDTDSLKGSRAETESFSEDWTGMVSPHTIHLRNTLLDVVLKMIKGPNGKGINSSACEEVQKVMGHDWLLLFMQGHVHSTTVIFALRILLTLLHNQSAISKFREGHYGGGWLDQTESVLQNRMGVVLGFNVGKGSSKKVQQSREINQEACHLPGFTVLQWLLPKHASVPEIYLLLLALSMGHNVQELPEDCQLDLNSIWQFIFKTPAGQTRSSNNLSSNLCPDAIFVILSQIRAMLNQPYNMDDDLCAWVQEYPVTLIQFLLYLYHNVPEFRPVCMSAGFLAGLVSTHFPYTPHEQVSSPLDEYVLLSEENSEVSSPSEDISSRFIPGLDIPALGVKTPDRNAGIPGNLSNHPARKYVMDFLRVIVVDSLSLATPKQTPPVLDMLLEASPERATPAQLSEFQTEILVSLMERLLAGDVLLDRESAMPIAAGGSFNHLVHNVFYLSSRVVDKLWQGSFNHKSKEVFDFVAQLIAQAKKRSHIPWDTIYHCLNRTILFQLSRPHTTVTDQMALLESLRHMTENRYLLFGLGNTEQEFIACVCHLLFCLTDDVSTGALCLHCQSSDLNRTTTWHVDPLNSTEKPIESIDHHEHHDNSHVQEGNLLVRNAARRVWDELVACKKQFIEEIFKVTLPNSSAGTKTVVSVDLKIARATMAETAAKFWSQFIAGEKNNSAKEQAQQTKSRLASRVSSGIQMLASRKNKRESASFKYSLTSIQEACMWTFTHLFIVRDLVELQYSRYHQSQQHLHMYIAEEWLQMETELTRERGLWGPPCGSSLDKWLQDMTEGPSRMRKKMIRNDCFYVNYPYRSDFETLENKPSKGRKAISWDSKKYYQRRRVRGLLEKHTKERMIAEAEALMEAENQVEQVEEEYDTRTGLRPSSLVTRQGSSRSERDEEDSETPDSEMPLDKPEEPKTDNQMVLRLLEEGEKIRHMFRCARMEGLDTSEGLLLFCKDHFYVVDGFTLLSSREICDIDYVLTQHQDPIIPKSSRGSRSTSKKMCSKFAYEDIREVHKRRYLLQPIAIEVFSSDGRNYLLAFPRKIRNKVYTRFITESPELTQDANQSVSGQKQNAQVEGGGSFFGNLIGEKSVTQRWERGEISNFQYLMALNTLAGRCYNDLMQYPVFPWILADYESEELDLCNPSTFRDLSKPMGAQTPDRQRQFQKRFDEWEDPTGETPAYHYGTHYSSAMIVASYLIRMEPFTQHFLRLQGGHFDLADRMFHSVKDGWLSASKHNMADVKELIPEFFYLPEFLTNHNNFDLGVKQNGIELGDALLPPWAKGDPREFIRMHREALECDYVSAHLHEWIDLIFGCKQQSKEAAEAYNVFHHLFYEGTVDIYSIDDPLKKNATIGFINNFGQIPKQLFKKSHPPKKVNSRVGNMSGSIVVPIKRLFFHCLDSLTPALQPSKELKGPVGQIYPSDRSILAVEQNKTLIPPSYSRYLAFGYADLSLRIGSYDTDKATTVFEGTQSGEVKCAACPNSKLVITGGLCTVVHVWQLETGKERSKQLTLKQALYGHTQSVTCLAVSMAYNIIVSGSRDQSCLIWDLNRLVFVRQLRDLGAPVSAVTINNLTGDIATCAGEYLYLWSINGDLIASVNTSTGRDQQILCCAMSELVEWDPMNVILTGSSDGVVRMWSVEYVQIPDISNSKRSSASNIDQISEDILAVKVTQSDNEDSQSDNESNSSDSAVGGSGASSPDRGSMDQGMSDSSPEGLVEQLDVLSPDSGKQTGSPGTSQEGSPADNISQGGSTGHPGGPWKLGAPPQRNVVGGKRSPDGSQPELANDNRDVFNSNYINERTRVQQSRSNGSHGSSDYEGSQDGRLLGGVHDNQNATSPVNGTDLQMPSPLQRGEYVMVTEKDLLNLPEDLNKKKASSAAHRNKLKPGFKWQRQLVFRSKLTMHTAFERKDNAHPAAVTALAISKDHMKIYVGDERGRVYSWSVADQPGKSMANHWVRDESSESCNSCNVKFTFAERRHHCRNCGKLFCAKCSRFESKIVRLHIHNLVRVCQSCYKALKQFSGEGM